MRSNKLESIQGLTNIEQLKPIASLSPLEEWQRGAIVNTIQICLLVSHILYNQKMLIDTAMDRGEKNLQFYNSTLIVKRLFGLIDDGYMIKKEFLQIKKDLKIKFDK
ncbi:MAG: hypothetical protein Q8S36_08390 [Sulfuricurvum sp.]|nr:hypothetical protein [Sulfuricurvum sp.]